MNKDNKALKEIAESSALVEYLLYHDLDFDDLKHFTPKYVKKAIDWKQSEEEEG